MTTYPLATLGPTITTTGISIPSYQDIYASLQASFQSIYGSTAVLDPDSQDGQLLAIIAQAIYDCNAACVAIYNAFSPSTAQGTGLSSIVKINGMRRQVANYSTVPVTVVGQAQRVISAGLCTDPNGYQWALPANVTFPNSGSITVTATCTTEGAIPLASGVSLTIANPSLGWQTATTAGAATLGNPVEQDGALRIRQQATVAGPSSGMLASIIGSVAAVNNVTAYNGHENPTSTTDSLGVPGHTVWIVVEGGNATSIAQAIQLKKGGGIQTFGAQSVVVQDSAGSPVTIHFDYYTEENISVQMTIIPKTGWSPATKTTIINAVVDFIDTLAGGATVYPGDVMAAASLSGQAVASTFSINPASVMLSLNGGAYSANPIPLAFNQASTTTAANVFLSGV